MDYKNRIINQFARDHHIPRGDTRAMLEALVVELELLKKQGSSKG